MRFLLAKTVIAIAFLAALSCEKSSPESAPLPVPGPSNDGVQLLSVGHGDTRILRYRLAKGTTTTLELAMDLDLETGGRPGKMPTLVLHTKIEVVDVLPSGDALLRTTITDAKMIDRPGATIPVSAVGQMTEQMTGVVHTATLTPDGTMRDAKVDTGTVGPALAQQLRQLTQTIEQIAVRLPAVPVGVGSKWTSKKRATDAGFELTTISTFEVTSIDGDRIGFINQSTLSAPDQKVDQQGVAVEVKDIGGGASGTGTLDLSRVTMVGTLTSEFRGTMRIGGQPSTARVLMKLRLTERGR